jgi:hypothetical protein
MNGTSSTASTVLFAFMLFSFSCFSLWVVITPTKIAIDLFIARLSSSCWRASCLILMLLVLSMAPDACRDHGPKTTATTRLGMSSHPSGHWAIVLPL